MEQSLLIWGLVLIITFPILTLTIGESIERLERRRDPFAKVLRDARKYLLPSLAIVLVMREMLNFQDSVLPSQIAQTALCIAATYTFLSLLNLILTTKAKKKTWQIRVPNLVFQLARILVVLGVAGYILSNIWKVDLNKVAEALGIGSLVIALALQDTLSNLVSGFLLLIESPFKVGDWLKIGDIEAQVLEMNWRAVRLLTRDRDVVIIPNGVLGQDTIYNYTLFDPIHIERMSLRFSFDDPPNRVKQVIKSAALSTEGILSNPPPEVLTIAYNEYAIDYEVKLFIKDFPKIEQIRNEFMTLVYYAAKRHNITIALPISIEGDIDHLIAERGDRTEEIAQYLRSLPYLTDLNRETINRLAQRSSFKFYGAGEQIIRVGEFELGFYIIQAGSVILSIKDIEGREQEVAHLSGSDFFGETVLLSTEPSLVSVMAIDDVTVILIEPEAVTELVQQNAKFARELNQLIEERKKAVRLARGMEDEMDDPITSNSQLKGYQLLRQFRDVSDT